MSQERTSAVTLKGNPLTLLGPELKPGDQAPDFSSMEGLANEVTLSSFEGKIKVFNVILSVDTPVCDAQSRKFNEEAANLPDSVEIVTVSMDLPFAQNRYCASAGIDRIKSITDHVSGSFGEAYGVLIKENRLLARAIFVVDKDNIVRHAQYVGEIAEEPDYGAAMEVVNSLI